VFQIFPFLQKWNHYDYQADNYRVKTDPYTIQGFMHYRSPAKGKTTLAKQLAKNKPYVNFENPSVQHNAELDPSAFLKQFKKGAIPDEVQRVPDIFRDLQEILDKNRTRGQFILTGSNNFLLQEQVSQSLAGRAGYLSLLPFGYNELQQAKLDSPDVNRHILTGGYPEIWNEKLVADTWLKSYVQTYVQRDVRLIRNISNLALFTRFIALCATHAGQILNRDELGRQTEVDTKTVLAWLGPLENSYIIYLLQPWYNNLNIRIVKSPKLYFYDTGLLCHLLGLKSLAALKDSNQYGFLFENWAITEIKKNRFNNGQNDGLYYFNDNVGNEVDLITGKNGESFAIEIKASLKVKPEMLQGLNFWQKYQSNSHSVLLHGGKANELVNNRLGIIP
jgi:predicted AAA+ superfamily ATPase